MTDKSTMNFNKQNSQNRQERHLKLFLASDMAKYINGEIIHRIMYMA